MASVDISAHSSPRCPQHTWYIREHPCPVLQPGTPAGHSRDWRPLTFTSCLRSHLFLFPLKLSVHVCVCGHMHSGTVDIRGQLWELVFPFHQWVQES